MAARGKHGLLISFEPDSYLQWAVLEVFSQLLTAAEVVVITFYMHTCPHSKALKCEETEMGLRDIPSVRARFNYLDEFR